MESDVEDFLEHFGVKGMRWGHRKDRSSTSSESPSGKKKFARNLAIATGTGVVGGLVVAGILKRSGAIPLREARAKNNNFDISKMNQDIKEMYKEGLLKDKQGLGRAPGIFDL